MSSSASRVSATTRATRSPKGSAPTARIPTASESADPGTTPRAARTASTWPIANQSPDPVLTRSAAPEASLAALTPGPALVDAVAHAVTIAVAGVVGRVTGRREPRRRKPSDDGGRDTVGLALDEVGGRGDLVGHGTRRHRHHPPVDVALAAVVEQHAQPGGAEGEVGEPGPPRPSGGVAEDDRER